MRLLLGSAPLYLWRGSKEKVAVDLHLAILADKDGAAMNVLQLESCVAGVVDYLARLKVAASRIDTTLWPGEMLQNDLEF